MPRSSAPTCSSSSSATATPRRAPRRKASPRSTVRTSRCGGSSCARRVSRWNERAYAEGTLVGTASPSSHCSCTAASRKGCATPERRSCAGALLRYAPDHGLSATGTTGNSGEFATLGGGSNVTNLVEHREQMCAVDKFDVSTTCKLNGIAREFARGDHEAGRSAFGRHDTIQLANRLHADFEGAPLLALN